jgi:hypothetical protein
MSKLDDLHNFYGSLFFILTSLSLGGLFSIFSGVAGINCLSLSSFVNSSSYFFVTTIDTSFVAMRLDLKGVS